ncbi:hypothetical protein GGR51DRAFT_563285 [Nemania sp. FL0031]|nr:hypothetical protein GGR51DRAFT_563285 [Nemania sp. FL0031]
MNWALIILLKGSTTRQWTNYFTLDAITDIGLSQSLGLLDRGNDRVTAQRPDGSTFETDIRQALYPTARKQSLLLWSYDHYKLLDKISNIVDTADVNKDLKGVPPSTSPLFLCIFNGSSFELMSLCLRCQWLYSSWNVAGWPSTVSEKDGLGGIRGQEIDYIHCEVEM